MTLKCLRCNKTFRNNKAYQQHCQDSSSHHECPGCEVDYASWDDVLEHCRDTGCRIVCASCNNGSGRLWLDSASYYEHLREKNVCSTCERHFSSPTNLTHHHLVHRTADYECLGCYCKFKTYGGMIIHLESGACNSELDDIDLNETAAMCYQWPNFIDEDYREELLDRVDVHEVYEKPYPFTCPTCGVVFGKLSSLFQHVESPACGQQLDKGAINKLRRWLSSRHG